MPWKPYFVYNQIDSIDNVFQSGYWNTGTTLFDFKWISSET